MPPPGNGAGSDKADLQVGNAPRLTPANLDCGSRARFLEASETILAPSRSSRGDNANEKIGR